MTKNETLLLESISERLDGIHNAIYGNGSPSNGMLASQVRQEAMAEAARLASVDAATKAKALTATVDGLVLCVGEHHKQLHLASLLKSVKFWGYALLAFVVVNLIIDVANPLVLALIKAWTGIALP